MAQFHEDPSLLTKEKLKSELMANNVPLPSADSKKDVYVQLYLKNLTVQNQKHVTPPSDTFSSDEEDSSPITGKKATRKTDRAPVEDKDFSSLTDEDLKAQLQKFGVHAGPVVASTRKLYESKLQGVLETALAEPETAVPEAVTIKPDGSQNGNTHSSEDQYSDKEDEVEPIPEPVPVASKPVRSRGKTPVTTRTSSRQRSKVQVEETATAGLEKTSLDGGDVLKEMFPNEPSTPTGIMATCRKPIYGAAGRPVKPLNLWSEEPVLQQVYTNTKSFVTDVGSAAPVPPAQSRSWFSFWLKLLLVLTLAASLYFAFQNITADQINTCQLFVQDNVIMPVVNYIGWERGDGK